MPILHVLILADFSGDETIAVIGHELQHVAEAMRGAPQGGAEALTDVFSGLDSREPGRGADKYKTATSGRRRSADRHGTAPYPLKAPLDARASPGAVD